ncbi:fimbrial protein [Halomonas salifodinae]|uniref:fimbrial protein n=1 Tax=Halomonas salifodinae TaxID=438745 RepID=UPI0033A8803E
MLALAWLLPGMVQAACHVNAGHVAQDITMNMGQVIISPQAQVGEVLAMREFTIHGVNNLGSCDGSSGGWALGRVLQGQPSALAADIHTTNVPGVGIRLSRRRQGQGLDDLVTYPHDHPLLANTTLNLVQGFFRVELIKIAPQTGSGPLSSGTYSTYYLDGSGPSRPMLTSSVLGSGITVVSSSCEVDAGSRNIGVDFGSVSTPQFTGIGSTQASREFSIELNCVGPTLGEDLVVLGFDYLPDPSGAPGVIRIDGGVDAASGVGVQLLDARSDAPIASGDSVDVGSLAGAGERVLSLPLRARYYQTEANVGGGVTRALATFTIEYR